MRELLLGLSLGLGAGLAPGPLLALVIGATLERGFAAGARIAAAPLVTDAPIIAVCVLVLSGLPGAVLAGLSLAGAAFALFLAAEALRGPAPEPGEHRGDLRRGALVNVLSPHPWLFWITVGGPLLVDAGDRSAGLAAAFLAGFYALLVGTKIAIAAAVHAGRRRVSTRATRLVSAALLAAAAVALAADGVARLT